MSDEPSVNGNEASKSEGFGKNVLLVALLYLLGDKALLLSKLGLRAYDHLINDGFSRDRYAYEISLTALALGVCFVIIITKYGQRELQKNNAAILIGVIISTIAALLNIVEVMVFKDSVEYGDVLSHALFFYVLWLVLFIFPIFLGYRYRQSLDISLLVMTALGLVIGLTVGAALRICVSAFILYGFNIDGVESYNNVQSQLRFQTDTFVALGTVWTIVTYSAWLSKTATKQKIIWSTAYTLGAFCAGYMYSALLAHPESKIQAPETVINMAVGFGMLSVAVVLPGILLGARLMLGDKTVLWLYCLLVFVTCFIAMLSGLTATMQIKFSQRVGLSVVQAFVAVIIPLLVYLVVKIKDRIYNNV